MRLRFPWKVLCAGVAVFTFAALATAQLELCAFQGVVKADQGKPIPGASLHLRYLGRGGDVTLKADKKGFFYRRGLQPGDYELTIEAEGFQPFRDRLRFRAGEEKRLDFQLGKAGDPATDAFNRGIDLFNRGDIAGAATAFEEVIGLAPDAPEAHVNLGLAYMRLGRTEDAINELEKANGLKPAQGTTELQLAAAYAEAKRFDKAIDTFEKAVSRFSDLADPLAQEAAVSLGSLYFSSGKVDEAMAVYGKAAAAQPQSAGALFGLGKCHFNKGDTAKALEYLEKVIAAAPDSPEATQARPFVEELKKVK